MADDDKTSTLDPSSGESREVAAAHDNAALDSSIVSLDQFAHTINNLDPISTTTKGFLEKVGIMFHPFRSDSTQAKQPSESKSTRQLGCNASKQIFGNEEIKGIIKAWMNEGGKQALVSTQKAQKNADVDSEIQKLYLAHAWYRREYEYSGHDVEKGKNSSSVIQKDELKKAIDSRISSYINAYHHDHLLTSSAQQDESMPEAVSAKQPLPSSITLEAVTTILSNDPIDTPARRKAIAAIACMAGWSPVFQSKQWDIFSFAPKVLDPGNNSDRRARQLITAAKASNINIALSMLMEANLWRLSAEQIVGDLFLDVHNQGYGDNVYQGWELPAVQISLEVTLGIFVIYARRLTIDLKLMDQDQKGSEQWHSRRARIRNDIYWIGILVIDSFCQIMACADKGLSCEAAEGISSVGAILFCLGYWADVRNGYVRDTEILQSKERTFKSQKLKIKAICNSFNDQDKQLIQQTLESGRGVEKSIQPENLNIDEINTLLNDTAINSNENVILKKILLKLKHEVTISESLRQEITQAESSLWKNFHLRSTLALGKTLIAYPAFCSLLHATGRISLKAAGALAPPPVLLAGYLVVVIGRVGAIIARTEEKVDKLERKLSQCSQELQFTQESMEEGGQEIVGRDRSNSNSFVGMSQGELIKQQKTIRTQIKQYVATRNATIGETLVQAVAVSWLGSGAVAAVWSGFAAGISAGSAGAGFGAATGALKSALLLGIASGPIGWAAVGAVAAVLVISWGVFRYCKNQQIRKIEHLSFEESKNEVEGVGDALDRPISQIGDGSPIVENVAGEAKAQPPLPNPSPRCPSESDERGETTVEKVVGDESPIEGDAAGVAAVQLPLSKPLPPGLIVTNTQQGEMKKGSTELLLSSQKKKACRQSGPGLFSSSESLSKSKAVVLKGAATTGPMVNAAEVDFVPESTTTYIHSGVLPDEFLFPKKNVLALLGVKGFTLGIPQGVGGEFKVRIIPDAAIPKEIKGSVENKKSMVEKRHVQNAVEKLLELPQNKLSAYGKFKYGGRTARLAVLPLKDGSFEVRCEGSSQHQGLFADCLKQLLKGPYGSCPASTRHDRI